MYLSIIVSEPDQDLLDQRDFLKEEVQFEDESECVQLVFLDVLSSFQE